MQHVIDFRDFVFDDKNLWISARSINGLMKVDYEKSKATYIAGFRNTTQRIELHGPVINTEDKIYFIPSLGSTMDIYDKIRGTVTSVEIYPQDMVWHSLSAYLVSNKIIILPFQTQNIICYDIESEEIITISQWEEDSGLKFTEEGYFFCSCGTVRGELLYAVSMRNNGIMELDTNDMSICWHHLSDHNMTFSTLVDDGKFLWMAANKGEIFIGWNIKDNIVKIYNNFPRDYKVNKELGIPFCSLIDCGNKILAIAIRANMSLWLDKETGVIIECSLLNQTGINHILPGDIEEYRLAKKLTEDTILLISCRDRAIVKYNWKQETIERNFIDITEEIQMGILDTDIEILKRTNTSLVINEDMITLDAFLNYLKQEKQDIIPTIESGENTQQSCFGYKIFANVKQSLKELQSDYK